MRNAVVCCWMFVEKLSSALATRVAVAATVNRRYAMLGSRAAGRHLKSGQAKTIQQQELTVAKTESTIQVDGREIKLSNLEKVLYPKAGFTKSQVIDYYIRIAPVLLPHLANRALTLKRYPNGVDGMHFYEKNCPSYRPEWMKTVKVWSEGNNKHMYYCTVADLPSLVWLGNLADLELHTSLSRAEKLDQPTVIAFDLDPGPPATIVQCCQVGEWVREIFSGFGLETFAKAVARLLEDRHPDLVVSDMKKALRSNKVFVDWSQNDNYKTTVNVYSLRAKDQPTVSTPVRWKEVEECLKKGDPELLVFTSDEVLKRVEKMGDLFEPVLTMKQKLPDIQGLSGEAVAAEKAKPALKVAKTTKTAKAAKMAKPAKRMKTVQKRRG